jgi:Tfp pilus assembly PilM family ATPase
MSPLALCNFVSYDILNKAPVGGNGAEGKAAEAGEQKEAIQAQRGPLGRPGEGGKKRCVVALDIGADNSNLVITDGERIIWQRPIPVGGNHFTRALTKEMKLTFAKAEHMKRNATKSPDLKKILASIRPVLNEFVSEVQRSLGYFTNTHRDAHIESMIGLGSAFRLPGLQKFLSEKLQLEVHKLAKLERLTGDSVLTAPAFTQNVLSFAVAYGLALQGLKKTKLQTNLLPQEIQFERMIRAKKPWAAAAAAALLLGVVGTAFGYAWQYHAYTASPVKTAREQGDGVAKEFNDWNSKYSTKDGEVKQHEDEVRKIIMGTDERLNWLMLNEFIDQCMPVPALRLDGKFKAANKEGFTITGPDGKDQPPFTPDSAALMVKDKNDHWQFVSDNNPPKPGDPVSVIYQTDPGAKDYFKRVDETKLAALKYFDRQEITKGGQTTASDEYQDKLIQINLESAYALWSPDVKPLYDRLVKENHPLLGMDPKLVEEMKKGTGLPEGAGWVIELRGYTYFYESPRFVMDTLVKEIARRGGVPEQATGGNPAQLGQTSTTVPPPPPTDEDGGDKEKAVAKDPVKEKEENWNKVIRGRVSHPFLLDYLLVPDAEPGKFEIIGGSALDSLVGGGGASGGGGMGRMMEGMRGGAAGGDGAPAKAGGGKTGGGGLGGGSGGSATGNGGFTALVSIGSGGSSTARTQGGPSGRMGGMGGDGPGGMGGDMKQMMDRMRGMRGMGMSGPMGGAMGGDMVRPGSFGNFGAVQIKPPSKKRADRTEFSLIFIWKEWTPSDDLVKKAESTTPETK